MSLGYVGRCQLEDYDGRYALYSYNGDCFDLDESKRKEISLRPGHFVLDIEAIPHMKQGSSRKQIAEEREVVFSACYSPDFVELHLCLLDELLTSSDAPFGGGNPRVVRNLLHHVANDIYETGVPPEKESFVQ